MHFLILCSKKYPTEFYHSGKLRDQGHSWYEAGRYKFQCFKLTALLNYCIVCPDTLDIHVRNVP